MSTPENPSIPQVIFTEEVAASMTGIGLIWAQASNGVIGNQGGMPWHVPEDLEHFRKMTTGHPVIMGRKTWESFPEKYRPLPDRTNIVITRQSDWSAPGAVVVNSLDQAIIESQFSPGGQKVWIIGGGEIFAQAAEIADIAIVTVIDVEADGDTKAPDLGEDWKFATVIPQEGWLTSRTETRYRFTMWRRTEA
ncbi:dihydrofolate reductase [Pseudarthrobacter sp. J1738]|uniref:dihydrofolate reductase n=1 Tax=unclassified Pseudarthrobacter TaxID=2647000 RepID=UPI003D2A9A32